MDYRLYTPVPALISTASLPNLDISVPGVRMQLMKQASQVLVLLTLDPEPRG